MPPDDVCPHHGDLKQTLDDMSKKLDSIIERLGKGDVTFATVTLRVDQIEKVVYGAVGLSLTAVAGAILAVVIKAHP